MGGGVFKSSALAGGCICFFFPFKAWPSGASLSPEGAPGPGQGRGPLLLSCGGDRVDRTRHHVQGGEGRRGVGPWAARRGRAVLRSACQEGGADVVP